MLAKTHMTALPSRRVLMLAALAVLVSGVLTVNWAAEKMTVLVISKRGDGALREIGRLAFDDSNGQIELSLSGQSPDHEALRKAWEKIAASNELPVTEGRQLVRNGQKVTVTGTRTVKRDSSEFRWAVYDTLEKEFGYSVEVE